jgi:hypothetical protein
MDLPFCKICGMNHRLGFCPLFQEPIAPVRSSPKQSGAAPPRAGAPSRADDVAGLPRHPHEIESQARPVEKSGLERARPLADASIRSSGEHRPALELPATEAAPGDVKPGTSVRRRGRPLQSNIGNSLAAQQPWKSEGMSRATWFRRQHA